MDYYNQRNKTTCEIYHELPILELLPSVQSSIYIYLHFGLKSSQLNQVKYHLKNIVKSLYSKANLLYSKSQVKNKLDVVFSFYRNSNNHLGIQKKIVENIHIKGWKVGIISNQINRLTEFDEVLYFPFSATISSLKKKKIIEECKCICSYIETHKLANINDEIYSYLVEIATRIEREASFIERLLEIKQTKLAILTNPQDLGDSAMQIACTNLGIQSILIPHGFLQRSKYPLTSSFVTSFAPHHDDYLKKMSLPKVQLHKLGWLEPSVTLSKSFCIEKKQMLSDINTKNKYNVLFLSQISGINIHRCPSFLYRVPEILKTLDKMSNIQTITIRLHPNECNDINIRKLLNDCECKKLRVSENHSIIDDLKSCNMIMSFSSTGLLYGPYLNMKAVEIRDEIIDSVWGSSVLPKEQVYNIGKNFNSREFIDFVLNVPVLNGQNIFYNYGSEYQSFDELLKKF